MQFTTTEETTVSSPTPLYADCVKPKSKFMLDTTYRRRHPFYPDWSEWKTIATTYHSQEIKDIQRFINYGNRYYYTSQVTELEQYLIDETFFLYNRYSEKLRLNYDKPLQELFYSFDYYVEPDFIGTCRCGDNYANPFNTYCKFSQQHMQSAIIAFLWAFVHKVQPKRFERKYYKRLERVILSLPEKYLRNFDLSLIADPPKYKGRGRNLLRELYARAYFDHFDGSYMVQQFEYYKHFIKQCPKTQGGVLPTNQSYSEEHIFVPGTLELAKELCTKYSLEELLLPQPQGLFDIKHEHHIADESLGKFKSLLLESQDIFFEGLRGTIVETGKMLMCMFLVASTVCLLSGAIIGYRFVNKILHLIYGTMAGPACTDKVLNSYARPQSNNDDDEEIEIPFVPTMLLNYIISPPKNILKKIWSSPQTDVVMRRIGYLGDTKIERGLDRMIDWVNKVLYRLKAWYAKEILGMEWEDIESDCHVFVKWNEEIEELLKSYYDGTFLWTDTTFAVVFNLYSRGLKFTREQAYSKYKMDAWRHITKLGNILELFKSHGCANQQIRNPPVVIYLHGDTGAGKSSMTYPMAVEILKGIFEREKSPIDLRKNWKSLVYMRAPEQEFWDGYENQLVTVFDDFSQMNDSQQNPNLELFEIIRAANCFPYPLHMASIDQKSNTTFTSKIIIISSNLSKPQSASLNFPEALLNRFEHCIYVTRDKGLQRHSSRFDATAYRLFEYNMKTNAKGNSLSYSDLIKKCVDSYFDRKSFVSSVEDYINDILADDTYVNMDPLREESDNIYEDILEFPLAQVGSVADYHSCVDGCERHEDIEEIYNPGPTQVDSTVRPVGKPISAEAVYLMGDHLDNVQNYGADYYHYDLDTGRPVDACWAEHKLYDLDEFLVRRLGDPTVVVDWLVEKTQLTFARMREGCRQIKLKYDHYNDAWTTFKTNHPYLHKATVAFTVLMAGMAFLKIFQQLKKVFWNEKKERKDAYAGGKRLSRSTSTMEVVAEPESYTATKVAVPKVEAYTAVKTVVPKIESYSQAKVVVPKVEAIPVVEGVKDLNASEILISVTKRNLYKMTESTCGASIGHVVFLKGKVALMCKHFLSAFHQALRNDPDAFVYLENVLLKRSFSIKIKDLLNNIVYYESPSTDHGPVCTRDLMACVIPTAIVHMDITPFVVTKGSVCRTDCTDVMLPVLLTNNIRASEVPIMQILTAYGRSALKHVEEVPISEHGDKPDWFIRDAWEYNLDTKQTMCGAPLIVRNTTINPGKICGIHVAGIAGTGQGWSTPLYSEDIDKILSHFDITAQFKQEIHQEMKPFPISQGQVPVEAEFVRLGQLERPIAAVGKTKIRPSELFGQIREPLTKPCLLTKTTIDGKEFDPRTYRLERLGNETAVIDETLIENAKRALVDEMSTVFSKTRDNVNANIKPVYSFEEACCGIDGEPFVNSIKRDTSSGFPFVQMKGFTRKEIFGADEVFDLETPACCEIRKRVENIISKAKQGIVLDHYFIDTLKDERKPLHKAHKTRLFSAGPLDYLIASKMYFNGVVALLSANRNHSHVSVGTNVYSDDWSEIVKVLHRKSKNVVAGDFEGFDASQHQRMLDACLEVLIQLSVRFLGATKEDVQVMQVLGVSLFNSMHISGSEVYQWTHSLPSGHYLTAIINSIFVNLAFCMSWMIAFDLNSYLHARKFWKECGIVAYGDDHLVSVPNKRLNKFNQFLIPHYMKQIGLGYTMEDKEASATAPSRLITDVSYLKRKFLFDKNLNRWLCPLSLDTVLEFPMWVHVCPDIRAQTIVELDKALEELSLHERDVWEKWAPVLWRCGESLGHYTLLKEQEEVRLVAISNVDLL